ncbi:MAG: sel1 repeat family protein [Ignavibacteriaceae bacterium]|nr:sel1 repeat family protein [Ignavibacteriaceae bacterium]
MKLFSRILFTFILLCSVITYAQDTTESLAFKNKQPRQSAPYFYRPELAYQIWQKFKLTQEANAGDILAQHELGLRYLMGEGLPADTTQAVYWIRKAAEKNLTSAKYNYAILLINGIGVEWDPFVAFNYFISAAEDGMVQAQYVVGVLHTDNLTVPRNWDLAYYWIKKSADGEYEPAQEIISELEPRVSRSIVDSLLSSEETGEETKPVSDPTENLTSSLGLVFIDFDALSDSVVEITDSMLIADLQIIGADSVVQELKSDSLKSLAEFVTAKRLEILFSLADNGSPEAQTLLGRLYEKGIYFNKNLLDAASLYYRALRNDSPKATQLFWKLSQQQQFFNLVQNESENENPIAKFVWYGLTSLNFDYRIVISDAINLLEESAEQFYLPAMMEEGLNSYTGRFGNFDPANGINIWRTAAQLGSKEAEIRLAASYLFDSIISTDKQKNFKSLLKAAKEGSLFAMVSVGLCYKDNIGTKKSLPEAVHYLRLASQRGSQFAYEELLRIYDDIRPNDAQFNTANKN